MQPTFKNLMAAFLLLCSAWSTAHAQEATIRKNLAERLSSFAKIDEVSKSPVNGLWEYDGRAAVLFGRNKSIRPFMARLARASKLVVRATTYDSKFVDMIFKVDGAADHIREVYSRCQDESPL